MLNQLVIVGRLTDNPQVKKTEKGKSVTSITVAVPRSFKNPEGLYETDFIPCVLWNGIADSTSLYCKKGDIVGVKGRIQVSEYNDKENNKRFKTECIAEKITFLTSKKTEE